MKMGVDRQMKMKKKRMMLFLGLILLAIVAVFLRKPIKRWHRHFTYEVSTGHFQDPEGLAVDTHGNIYVADEDWSRFTMLDREGNTLARFDHVEGYLVGGQPALVTRGDCIIALGPGHVIAIAQFNLVELDISKEKVRLLRIIGGGKGTAAGDFGDPEGVARDAANGDLYVTDEDNRRIQVFDKEGKFQRQWPVLQDPESICVFADRVYLTFSKDDWVGCYSKQGELQFRFGKTGSGAGEFRNPDFVCVSPQDLLYISDTKNNRIQVFDLDGHHQFSIGRKGRGPGEFREPEDLGFDPDGNLVVADSGNHRIQILTADGKPIRIFD